MDKEISTDAEDLIDGVVKYEPVEQRTDIYINEKYNKRLFVKDYQLYSFKRVGDNISERLVDIEWEHSVDFSHPVALLPDYDSMNPYRDSGEKKRVPLQSIIRNIMGPEFDHGIYCEVYKSKFYQLHNKKYDIKEIDLANYPAKSVFSFRNKLYKNFIVVKTDSEYILVKCEKNGTPQLQRQKLIGYGKDAFYYINYEDNKFTNLFYSRLKYMLLYNETYTNTLLKKWDKFFKMMESNNEDCC